MWTFAPWIRSLLLDFLTPKQPRPGSRRFASFHLPLGRWNNIKVQGLGYRVSGLEFKEYKGVPWSIGMHVGCRVITG